MTQPNSGESTPQPTDQQPTVPASGTGQAQPNQLAPPTPPGFVPASNEDEQAQQLLADAIAAQQPQGDPAQLGDAGKRALDAERQARKAAEEAAKKHAKQLEELRQQLEQLKPAAELFAQFRKAAVPEEEKTDTERLQEQIAKLQQETAAERRQRWLLEIIQDHGLSREDAKWLRGETREELEASAAEFAARLAAARPAPPAASGTPADGQQPSPPPAAVAPMAAPAPKPDPSQGARGPVDINTQSQDALAKGDLKTHIALELQRAAQGAR